MTEQQEREVGIRFDTESVAMTEADLDKVAGKKEKVFSLLKKVGEHAEDFKLCWALLMDYKAGRYKTVPWKLIAGIIFAFIYLLSPLDVIPDVIPVLGFTDDVSVFGLVLAGFAKEIQDYKNWRIAANGEVAQLDGSNTLPQ